MAELTFNVLWEILNYDLGTGKLFWRERPRKYFKSDHDWRSWNTRFSNREAFSYVSEDGHKQGLIFGKQYQAHRVIWCMCFGYWPDDEIDHIDGNPANNLITNLRIASSLINSQNKTKNRRNKSGVSGVIWNKKLSKWMARINDKYKSIYLGVYNDLDDAIRVRKQAEINLNYHSNHGREDLFPTKRRSRRN